MSESEVGLASATTRQNAGRLLYNWVTSTPLKGAGGPLKVPAAIVCARVIVVFGIFAPLRRSHASCANAAIPEKITVQTMAHSQQCVRRMNAS